MIHFRQSVFTILVLTTTGCGESKPQKNANPTPVADAPVSPPAHKEEPAIGILDTLEPSERNSLLDAILSVVLTDPELQPTRGFYGSEDKHVALVFNPNYGVPWPKDYEPHLPGMIVSRSVEGSEVDVSMPRHLGIRIDKFALTTSTERDSFTDSQIEVTLMNAGGNGEGAAHIGGCSVYFSTKQVDGKWTITFTGAMDP